MSNLPLADPYINNNTIEGSQFLISSPLDHDSWSLYQEILQSASPPYQSINPDPINSNHKDHEQQHSEIAAGVAAENGLNLMKRNRKTKNSGENAAEQISAEEEEEEGTSYKKMDHNAKERIRRMKLNASYLALRALMPDSRRSKKRWSAPVIVDRVLKYIPELEKEVEGLRSTKENDVKSAAKNKIAIAMAIAPTSSSTVSVNKINEEEAIIQICVARDQNDKGKTFLNLLQCLEDEEDICIKTASVLYISDIKICSNLHIQINHTTTTASKYCIEDLSDKVAKDRVDNLQKW